jgi:hypothetical protein
VIVTGVGVNCGVKVSVGVKVGVTVLDGVEVGFGVNVSVEVLVGVNVGLGVLVLVDVGVYVAIAQAGAESLSPLGSLVRSYSSYILTWEIPGNCFSESASGPIKLYSPPCDRQYPERYTRRIPSSSSIFRYPINPLETPTNPRCCSAPLGPLKYSSTTDTNGFTDESTIREVASSYGRV